MVKKKVEKKEKIHPRESLRPLHPRGDLFFDENLIDRLARLSSIELSPEERDVLRADLQRIVSYVERLGKLDLNGADASGPWIQPGNILQPDAPRNGLPRGAAFQNAPETQGLFFKAPPIIER